MVIAIRGTTPATAGTTSNPVSVSLTGARQPNTGDVLVIIHSNNFYDFTNMATPTVGGSSTGVTAITDGSIDAGSNSPHIKPYTYVVGSTGDLTVSATETGSADEEKGLFVYVLSGVDTTTPIDVAGTFTDSADPMNAPSISPTSSDAYLICHVTSDSGDPFTPPGGMAEQYDSNVGGFISFSGAVLQLSASGATGTKSFDATGVSQFATLSVAIKTDSGGPPPESDAGPFPTIPTSGASRILSSANTNPAGTHTFPNLSSLTKNAGDLLLAIICQYDGNSTNAEFSSWGAGFTEFVDQATTTTMAIGAAYKWSTGAETGTFTVTSADTSANDSQCLLLSIAGADKATPPEGGTIANGTGAAANPGSLNPAGWDAENTLWIAVCGAGEDSTTGAFTAPSAAPTNYSDLFATTVSADVVGGVYGAVAFRQVNAASEDAGGFTVDLSNARNSALVIAVRPEKYLILPMRRNMELPLQMMMAVR